LSSRALKIWFAGALAVAATAMFAAAAPAAILYTNNYNSEQLASFTVGADGLLTPVPGSPFQFADPTEGFSITPDGRLMVESFGFDSMAGSFALSPNGNITQAQAPIGPGGFGLPAITPDGQFAYILTAPGGTIAYRLGSDGSMSKVGGPFGSADGAAPAVTPDGRFLFVPSYSDGTIERFAIQSTGALTSLGATSIGTEGSLVVRVTPDGRFAILLINSSFGVDHLRSFAIGTDGSLTEVGPPVETTGDVSGPPVISPNGQFVYMTDGNEESITTYSIGPNGALAQIGAPTPTGLSQPQGIGMSNDGLFLYVEPQGGEKIQAFSVAANGSLTKIGTPTPTGGFSDGVTLLPLPAVPSAKLASPPPVTPGKQATFTATATDVGASITSYSWNFGDGTTVSNTGSTASHTYKKAGVYTVRVTANDSAGCIGFVYTGQTSYCNGRDAQASATVDTLPVIRGLRVAPSRFTKRHTKGGKKQRRGVKHGVAFNYSLSENAAVTFAIERKLPGRIVGKTCKPKTKRNGGKRKCALIKNRGSLSVAGKAGRNQTQLPARIGGRPLKFGSYIATATAVDSAGGESTRKSVDFGIAKPRHP
jgi:6-phosphogluconolactonase (cycloisomerase 2 family)